MRVPPLQLLSATPRDHSLQRRSDELQQLKLSERAGAPRLSRRHVSVHGNKSKRHQAFDGESIDARWPRCGVAQTLQRFPLIVSQIVIEFIVHGVQGLLAFLGRVIAAAHEFHATTTSQDLDAR